MDFAADFAAADRFIRAHEVKKLQVEALRVELEKKQTRIREMQEHIAFLEETRVFLEVVAEGTRDELLRGLEELVTLCLQAVFGPDYQFKIEVDTSRHNTTLEFLVINHEGPEPVELPPEDNMGGGVIDAVAMGLRWGMFAMLKPRPPGPLLLDEPAKMVSGDKIDSIGRILQMLGPLFRKQVIMITHHMALWDMVDRAIFIRKENGVAIAESGMTMTDATARYEIEKLLDKARQEEEQRVQG